MATDLTVEILREIRDGIQELRVDFNARLETLAQRQDQTNARLDRVEHGLNDLGTFMRQIALDQARHERRREQHVRVQEQAAHQVGLRISAPAVR